jgi:hypothetical protein
MANQSQQSPCGACGGPQVRDLYLSLLKCLYCASVERLVALYAKALILSL